LWCFSGDGLLHQRERVLPDGSAELVINFDDVPRKRFESEDPKTGALDEPLEPLRPFLSKTWRGELKDSKPGQAAIDGARWESALNGKVVRVLHSINDGAYGGESLIHGDKERSQLRYHYFSTAGFYNVGVMTITNRTITAVEQVFGTNHGVTEVRSTYQLHPDGTLLNRSQYLKNGEPAGSREVLYKEAPKADVRFK
jgi:hypothetical protein